MLRQQLYMLLERWVVAEYYTKKFSLVGQLYIIKTISTENFV
jgi:hypothetical protein